MTAETPIIFASKEQSLVGILHESIQPSSIGVVIIVGGPQTRVGSHRAFVELARYLASNGVHVFRFDYTGAGDSGGEATSFIDVVEDIGAAVECFASRVNNLNSIGLWGLCDAASAIAIYLNESKCSPLVDRLVLLNPWVNQPHTQAKTYLKHYYLQRLMSREFWRKLFSGKVSLLTSAKEIHNFSKQSQFEGQQNCMTKEYGTDNYVEYMASGLERFEGKLLFILAERDLVGQEFKALAAENSRWQDILAKKHAEIATVRNANHTFAHRHWKEEVNNLSLMLILS